MIFTGIAIAVFWIVWISVLVSLLVSSRGGTWDDELPRRAEVPIAGDSDAWRATLNSAAERDES